MGQGSLALADWRRRTADLYARVRHVAASDPAEAHALWRTGRDALFASHPSSPLAADDPRRVTGLAYEPYNASLRLTATLEPAVPASFTAVTATDGEVGFDRLGTVDLPPLARLDLWWLTGYGGGLWLPLRDGGSGTLSYGGGRYLLDTAKGADLGTAPRGSAPGDDPLVLDLNFLYAPSCAHDPAWACPLAPEGNRIDAVITAGEMLA